MDEVICAEDYGTGLLAQSILNPGLTQVFDNLLTYGDDRSGKDTNELYVIKSDNIPNSLKKTSFSEASKRIFESRDKHPHNPVILLGMIRNGIPIINPVKSEETIEETDDLLVLSFEYPDLSYLD